jgi:hypothetical protein
MEVSLGKLPYENTVERHRSNVINATDCRYTETTSSTYPSSDTVYVGLGTGLLPAAAIASSNSLIHLLTIATDIVCVCFRVGLEARCRAQQLERDTSFGNSWSVIVSDVSPSETQSSIDQFQNEQVCALSAPSSTNLSVYC